MNNSTRSNRRLAAAALVAMAGFVHAAQAQTPVIGTVTNLSGQLVAKRADGAKLLALNSQIREGDLLITGMESYTSIRFMDGAELALQPDTRMVVRQYVYVADKPLLDKVELHLEQGGFRSTDGLLGERSKTAMRVTTPDGELRTGAAPVAAKP